MCCRSRRASTGITGMWATAPARPDEPAAIILLIDVALAKAAVPLHPLRRPQPRRSRVPRMRLLSPRGAGRPASFWPTPGPAGPFPPDARRRDWDTLTEGQVIDAVKRACGTRSSTPGSTSTTARSNELSSRCTRHVVPVTRRSSSDRSLHHPKKSRHAHHRSRTRYRASRHCPR
jgi:hypothetical protein